MNINEYVDTMLPLLQALKEGKTLEYKRKESGFYSRWRDFVADEFGERALFPEDSDQRKTYPIKTCFLDYFPAAIAAVAKHSYENNAKHNGDAPPFWNRSKSQDEADALVRHLLEEDYVGMAWRAMALLQKDLESKGAPVAPAARSVP